MGGKKCKVGTITFVYFSSKTNFPNICKITNAFKQVPKRAV